MTAKRFLCYLILLCLIFAPKALAGMLVGATLDAIYDIDPDTGVASNPRATAEPFSITFAGDVLYGVAGQSLYTLDMGTGESTLLGTLPIHSSIGAVDLAWDARNDRLLGIFVQPGRSTTSIYEIDPVSLNAQGLRLLDRLYRSLAFTEAGDLFAVDPFSEEVGLLDPTDFSTSAAAVLSMNVGGVAISPDGEEGLYLLSESLGKQGILYSLNPSTGMLAVIGGTETDSRFLSMAYVPEVSTLVLVLLGAGALFGAHLAHLQFHL